MATSRAHLERDHLDRFARHRLRERPRRPEPQGGEQHRGRGCSRHARTAVHGTDHDRTRCHGADRPPGRRSAGPPDGTRQVQGCHGDRIQHGRACGGGVPEGHAQRRKRIDGDGGRDSRDRGDRGRRHRGHAERSPGHPSDAGAVASAPIAIRIHSGGRSPFLTGAHGAQMASSACRCHRSAMRGESTSSPTTTP